MPQRTIEITSYIYYSHTQIGNDRNSSQPISTGTNFSDRQRAAIQGDKTLDRHVQWVIERE